MMAKPVVVPLDGSEKDARALPVAASLANLADAGLHLVRVFEAPAAASSSRAEAIGVDAAAAELRDFVRGQMAAIADHLAEETGRSVTWDVLDGADVAATLVRHAAERDARFVVMGTRAASAAGRALRGSVADQVMRESTRPVVLVPPGADTIRGKRLHILRVLVPLDGSAIAAKALEYILALPRAKELEYVLLEVVRSGAERERREAEQRLGAAAERVRAQGVAVVDCEVMEGAEPGRVIAGAVREVLADLIAMSTRGAGGLRRMVLGSVAEGVVRSSEVPVMLLTPAELGVAEAR